MKNAVFWDVAPCKSSANRRFGGAYRLHLQVRRRKRYLPPKRQFTFDLHGATSQKTAFFIVTIVKTSNLNHIKFTDKLIYVYLCIFINWIALFQNGRNTDRLYGVSRTQWL
jgi:hypothetical protein